MRNKFLQIMLFFFFVVPVANSDISLETFTGGATVPIPFVGTIEAKKKQFEDLDKKLVKFQKKKDDTNKDSSQLIKKIDFLINETKKELRETADSDEKELLNKKISVLSDRKQNLINYQELWKSTEEIIKKDLKQIETIILFEEKKKEREEGKKPVFTWKELQKSQTEIYELIAKIDTEKSQQEELKKQKIAEKENLYSLQKQKDSKVTQSDEIANKIKIHSEKESEESLRILKLKLEIISEEINLLKEKIESSNLLLEKFDFEIQYKDDEVEYKQSYLNILKNEFKDIKELLKLEPYDIESARSEWQNEVQKNLQIKEGLNKQRDKQKLERDTLYSELDTLKTELRKLKEVDQDQQDKEQIYLLESNIQSIKSSISLLDSNLHLIDVKKDQLDLIENLKKIQYEILDVRYKFGKKEIDLQDKIREFKNQREIALNYKKNLTQKKASAINSLMETNKLLESVKAREEDVRSKKDDIFKGVVKSYHAILLNLSKTTGNLNNQLKMIQEYLTINEELITKQQNEILNQYNFLIKDIEEKLTISNIWERSPKAISLRDLQKALLDAETFFQNIFWDTNKYLSPTILISNLKTFKLINYFWLLIFVVLFFITLLLLKLLLVWSHNKIDKLLKIKHISFLYLLQTLIEICLEHLKLIWGYLFILLHIAFDFKYIFSSIVPVVNSYFLAAFHLISIPILIYLTKHLLIKLKDLNERLEIFAEKFQNQFIFLSAIILYSSAVILPLRKAFLNYSAESMEFPDVLMAAYILIIVLVLLFAVNKEDVLRLIPDNKFFMWIKKQIDTHYYPVFIFFMGLLIISNPYIGYSNLAWYLAFVVPLSIAVIYGIFFVHTYIRKYSLYFFLSEEDDELHDKFEYAKTYYGFFIIASFLFLVFLAFFFLSRIWNLGYTPQDLWRLLSETWVIKIGEGGNKLGLVQFITIITYVIFGFMISSLINKFILNKLFDVFRTEPGTQNTLSRITHYFIIIFVTILGFAAIHLEGFIMYSGGLLMLGAGFGLKDMISDFIAGFFVLIERPVEIGHFIEIDEIRGTVHRISARATTIRTARNFAIIIPNKELVNKPIINWGQGRFAVGFEMNVTVSYGADPVKVKELLLETIQKHPMVLKVPAITVRLEDFLENGVQFFVRAFVSSRKVRDQWDIASDLRFTIISVFKENNIVIPFPHTVVSFSKTGNTHFAKAIDIKFDDEIDSDPSKKGLSREIKKMDESE
ncbi:MAG: mechanosensitive ion channel domain-containing protein [bacterium]